MHLGRKKAQKKNGRLQRRVAFVAFVAFVASLVIAVALWPILLLFQVAQVPQRHTDSWFPWIGNDGQLRHSYASRLLLDLNESVPYDIDRFQAIADQSSTLSRLDFNFSSLVLSSSFFASYYWREGGAISPLLWRLDDEISHGREPPPTMSASPWTWIASSRSTQGNNSVATATNFCQVFCRFPDDSFSLNHFPHFLQQAYPCWSLLQSFVGSAKHFYFVFNNDVNLRKVAYIQSFLEIIAKRSNLHITSLTVDRVTNSNSVGRRLPRNTNGCGPNDVSVAAVKAVQDSGWNAPVRYFRNETKDFENLQKAVLGNDFRIGPSCLSAVVPSTVSSSSSIHILILDRKGSTRDWAFSRHAKRMLEQQQYIGEKNATVIVVVNYVESFSEMTLIQQAKAFHSADIVISPHGAQLANLAYIRPCTVVVELFPPGFYLQFFQSLVVAAGGISYEGYPSSRVFRDRYQDSLLSRENGTARGILRSARILASPQGLVDKLPEFYSVSNQCCLRRIKTTGTLYR